MVFSISRREGAAKRWQERWLPKIDSNWGKHFCIYWFGKKLPSNRIKNDSRFFEHPQDCSSLDSERGFGKESCVHVLFPTPWHLSKVKIESHLAKTLRWLMQTNFFNKIVMGDETWCFAYDPETKRKSSEWVGETFPQPKKGSASRPCW